MAAMEAAEAATLAAMVARWQPGHMSVATELSSVPFHVKIAPPVSGSVSQFALC